MKDEEVLEQLKAILVERLKFDSRRAADVTLEMVLPKGLEGSLGLDSLDFIELSIAIEQRFGFPMDEAESLAPHFQSFDTLVAYISSRLIRG